MIIVYIIIITILIFFVCGIIFFTNEIVDTMKVNNLMEEFCEEQGFNYEAHDCFEFKGDKIIEHSLREYNGKIYFIGVN